MEKNNVVFENNGRNITMKYQLTPSEALDDMVLDRLKANYLEAVGPVQYSENAGDRVIYSHIPVSVSFASFARKALTKAQVLTILKNLISGMDIGKFGIPVSYILKDKDCIYIDENTLGIYYFVVPVKDNGKAGVIDVNETQEFFRSLVAGLKFDESDKDNYVARILTAINSDRFSTGELNILVNEMLVDLGDEQLASVNQSTAKVDKLGVMRNRTAMGQPMQQGMPQGPMGQPMPQGSMGQPMQQGRPMNQPQGMPQGSMGQPMQQGRPMNQPQGMPQGSMGQPMPQGRPMNQPQGMPQGPMGQPMPQGRPMNQPQGMPQGPMGQPMPQGRPMNQPQGMPQGPMGQPIQQGRPMNQQQGMPQGPMGMPQGSMGQPQGPAKRFDPMTGKPIEEKPEEKLEEKIENKIEDKTEDKTEDKIAATAEEIKAEEPAEEAKAEEPAEEIKAEEPAEEAKAEEPAEEAKAEEPAEEAKAEELVDKKGTEDTSSVEKNINGQLPNGPMSTGHPMGQPQAPRGPQGTPMGQPQGPAKKFDPMTGKPIEENKVQPGPMGPMGTGHPMGQPQGPQGMPMGQPQGMPMGQPQGPAKKFDPMTGKPIEENKVQPGPMGPMSTGHPMGQPQGPQGMPMGQPQAPQGMPQGMPKAPQGPQGPAKKFDPMTGKPIEENKVQP
ncbi:MAG: hypothetical protein K6E10_00285 [Eubacterium sp.]|nr:hypothetical protein [Eubacterium sp.]